MDMGSIHDAAWAFYRTLSYSRKQDVKRFFDKMDADNSDSISIREFMDFLDDKGYQSENLDWLFQELDADRNGVLDFQELVTFFYMLGREEYVELFGERARTEAPSGQRRRGDQKRRWNREEMLKLFDVIVNVFNSMLSLAQFVVQACNSF